MPVANVNPDELAHFAQQLVQFTEQVQQRFIVLHGQFKQLGATWRDQEYKKFAQEFEYTERIIRRFTDMAKQHVKILLRKSRLARAYFQATIKSIRSGFHEGWSYSPQMMQGKAGEMVTLNRGNYHLLDNIVDKLKTETPGGHFKIYDNIGENVVGSVKVRGIRYSRDSKTTQNYISAYVHDFFLAIGHIKDNKKLRRFESAAMLLLEAKEKQIIPTSQELQKVTSIQEMKDYLRMHAVLFIPDNHVSEVREVVKRGMKEDVKKFVAFGLKPNSTEYDVNEYLYDRIRPIGVTSETIGKMLYMELTSWLIPFLVKGTI